MIHRYAEKEVPLQDVIKDLEGGLEQPENLEKTPTLKDFSDVNFQLEYTEDGRYTAVNQEYAFHIEEKENELHVETGRNQEEETNLKKFKFGTQEAELPDRPIGGRSQNPIETALRSYANQLYPEKTKPGQEQEEWRMDSPPSER